MLPVALDHHHQEVLLVLPLCATLLQGGTNDECAGDNRGSIGLAAWRGLWDHAKC